MSKNFARVYSAQPYHLEGKIVSVEVDITNGMHSFSIVGLPDKAVEESRDRVSSAIKNSGFTSPKQENHKTIVSLAPAEFKKEGSYFDCAIAIGYLLANHDIEFNPSKKLFIGELSLNGELQPISGILPIIQTAKQSGFTEIFVPKDNAREAALIGDITIYPSITLKQVISHINETNDTPERIIPQELTPLLLSDPHESLVDFSHIVGQETVKRALEIAAAGGHNILLSGPPGTGKTMLARAFTGILPPLDKETALEVTGIHSIAGILNKSQGIITRPPFRSPHHTASYISLVGGGGTPRPGEITLAHRGILFMDEFPEFGKLVLESLRQPMEDKLVTISRAKGTATFPAQFILVAAMNPCPCGYFGSREKVCTCNQFEITRYRKKISGPILDRIDLWLTVEHISYDKLSMNHNSETSMEIKKRVASAREIQKNRYGTSKTLNATLTAKQIGLLHINSEAVGVLNSSSESLKLSPRSYHRITKVAQTIADLSGSEEIKPEHILEAFQYRPRQ